VLDEVLGTLETNLLKGTAYSLTEICNYCIENKRNVNVTNRELRVLLSKKYGDRLRVSLPKEANQSALVVTAEDIADTVRFSSPVRDSCEKNLWQ
jgi:hypothetical protein